MSEHEEITKILKDFIAEAVVSLDKGDSVMVRGGYIMHSYKDKIIDSHCSTLVNKLISLGYTYTTNHGHGCKDYTFTKKIEL